MGLFQSQPVTRSEVTDLSHRFQKLSDNLDVYLPWVTFFRNGSFIVSFLGAANMLMRSVTLYSLGGEVAVQLFLLAAVMHSIGSVFQAIFITSVVELLLERFFKSVPNYMDTSAVPKPPSERLSTFILTLSNFYAYILCQHMAEGFHIWRLLVSVGLIGLNALFLLRIVRTRSDADFQTICHCCNKCLKAVLQANADP